MIKEGALRGPGAIRNFRTSLNSRTFGKGCVRAGPFAWPAATFKIVVNGKTNHAALPLVGR